MQELQAKHVSMIEQEISMLGHLQRRPQIEHRIRPRTDEDLSADTDIGADHLKLATNTRLFFFKSASSK